MDFFESANPHISELNENETKIFEYVVRNIHQVGDMSIRILAGNCFVSTTTIMRFVKKLGFDGYRDFIDAIKLTCHTMDDTKLPEVVRRRTYSEEYLKNIIESVHVLSQEKIDRFKRSLRSDTVMFFYGAGLDREIAHHAYRLFTSLGYYTYFPTEDYEIRSTVGQLKDGDMLFLFSLSGTDQEIIRLVEDARLRCKPTVTTITQSANNLLQSMSDIDLYVFTDQIVYRGLDFSARVSMMALVDLLVYSLVTDDK